MDITAFNLVECCKVGLMHTATGRFLTIEVFNNELNVSGTALRKRQVWTMLVDSSVGCNNQTQDDSTPLVVYWLNPFGRLLSADKDGRVACNATQPGGNEQFVLEFNPSGNGEMAIKSHLHGYYLNGSDTQVSCFSKTIRWWALRIAMHPQINIKNVFRSRYAHLLGSRAEMRCDLAHPWDEDAVFRLHQIPLPTGPGGTGLTKVHRYGQVAICTESSCQEDSFLFLCPDGSLSKQFSDLNLFSLEIRPGFPTVYSFRHVDTGAYLSAIGQGTLKTKTNNANSKGREEMFIIERASCQVAVIAANDKFVSMKQGVEILANQRELNDTEIFQMEYTGGGAGFDAFRTVQSALTSVKELCCAESMNSSNLVNNNHTSNAIINNNNNNNNNNVSFEALCASALVNGSNSLRKPSVAVANGKENGHSPAPPQCDPNAPFYTLYTGAWRLRSKEGKLWNLRPNAPVHHTGKDGEPDSEFDTFFVTSIMHGKPGSMVVKSRGSGLALSAKKLGAVSCIGPKTSIEDQTQRPQEEFFRIYPFVNRRFLIVQSAITGGFVGRNPVPSKTKLAGIPLDCTAAAYEEFILRHLPNSAGCQLFAYPRGAGQQCYYQWVASEAGLHLQPTIYREDQNLDELDNDKAEPGTEFVFYLLGNGRCLIRPVNMPNYAGSQFCMLRAETKGDIKVLPCAIGSTPDANCIWDL